MLKTFACLMGRTGRRKKIKDEIKNRKLRQMSEKMVLPTIPECINEGEFIMSLENYEQLLYQILSQWLGRKVNTGRRRKNKGGIKNKKLQRMSVRVKVLPTIPECINESEVNMSLEDYEQLIYQILPQLCKV